MELEVAFKDVFCKPGEAEGSTLEKSPMWLELNTVNFPLFPKHTVKNSVVH